MPSGNTREVFVISDLHLGGRHGDKPGDRGFRINTHTKQLEDFLTELRQRAEAGRQIELVINGDFVDFLAEGGETGTDWQAFIEAEEEAVARLDQIVTRDGGVFQSLADLIAAGAAVTLLLGNHDLELSVPMVRARLREHLRAGRNSGFSFIYDGEAYIIGDALIEHGNRYDGFNVVDFDLLRRYRSESSRRLELSADATFVAPPGSYLVQEIMNPIKEDYGFIDLLKPETDAAVPLVLALEPSLAKDVERIHTAAQVEAEARSRMPVAPARPRQPGNIRANAESPAAVESFQAMLRRRLGAQGADQLDKLTLAAVRESQRAEQQIGAGKIRRALSFARMVLFTKEWETRVALLLEGFRQIQNERIFSRNVETEACYLDAAEELAKGGFRYVLFGHTHLAKDVELRGGSRYLNTGTWADLMRLPADLNGDSLKEFATAVKDNQFGHYVKFMPMFAHLRFDEERTISADLREYESGLVRTL